MYTCAHETRINAPVSTGVKRAEAAACPVLHPYSIVEIAWILRPSLRQSDVTIYDIYNQDYD